MLDLLNKQDPPEARTPLEALLPLEVRGVCLEIDGRHLLNGVELRLEDASLSILLGQNGAGKSLLLRIMHGLLSPTKGLMLWGGSPLNERIRLRQAMVFQKPVLLRRTAAGNIAHALAVRGVRRKERYVRA